MDTKTYTENLYNITFNDETAIDIPEVTDKLVRNKFSSSWSRIELTIQSLIGRKFNYNASSTLVASTLNEQSFQVKTKREAQVKMDVCLFV